MVLFTTIEYVCSLTNIGCYTISTTISVIQTTTRVLHTGYTISKYIYEKTFPHEPNKQIEYLNNI